MYKPTAREFLGLALQSLGPSQWSLTVVTGPEQHLIQEVATSAAAVIRQALAQTNADGQQALRWIEATTSAMRAERRLPANSKIGEFSLQISETSGMKFPPQVGNPPGHAPWNAVLECDGSRLSGWGEGPEQALAEVLRLALSNGGEDSVSAMALVGSIAAESPWRV